ncbi:MAG: transposase [Blautia faecis]
MVLHTFGRDLKWNPHIHCLISEGGYSDDGFWRPVHSLQLYLSRVMLSAQHCLMKWDADSDLLSKK